MGVLVLVGVTDGVLVVLKVGVGDRDGNGDLVALYDGLGVGGGGFGIFVRDGLDDALGVLDAVFVGVADGVLVCVLVGVGVCVLVGV